MASLPKPHPFCWGFAPQKIIVIRTIFCHWEIGFWGHKVHENGKRVFGEAGGWNADEALFQGLGQSTGLQFPKSGSEGKGEEGAWQTRFHGWMQLGRLDIAHKTREAGLRDCENSVRGTRQFGQTSEQVLRIHKTRAVCSESGSSRHSLFLPS